ncbi:MAG: DUF983 domain-containing protein [Candidatus Methylacidiphilales bacterium]
MCNKFESNKGLSIIKAKCPQCQSGKMYQYSALKLNGFTQMFDTCPVCNLTFEVEPGFFWGAMYVSYGITTGMMLVIGALVYILSGHEAGFWGYIIPIFLAMFLSIPFTYRYARVLMLYLFSPIRFNKDLANKA